MGKNLSFAEKQKLAELEAVIRKHLAGFFVAEAAFREIADRRLYADKYDSFNDYYLMEWSPENPAGDAFGATLAATSRIIGKLRKW